MIRLMVLTALLVTSLAGAVETLTVLDRAEPFEGLTFHAGHVWVGSSRTNFNSDYKVRVFDRSDRLVKEIVLNHSVQSLYPYSTDSVLAVGTGHTPNLTMYTILSLKGGTIASKTITIPAAAWANRWLGTVNGRDYFTDPGGNSQDTAGSTNPNLPAQTIFRMDGKTPRYLSTRLRLPVGGMAMDGRLFVLQREGIGDMRSNLAIVNPADGKLGFAFPAPRRSLTAIARLAGTSFLGLAERDADQLVVLDAKSLKIVAELKTAAEPKAVAAMGNCLFAGSFTERGVQVFKKTAASSFETVMTLPMDLPESEFARLFFLAVDEGTGRVYARSNLACNPMVESCTDDRNRVVSWPGEAAQVLAACKG